MYLWITVLNCGILVDFCNYLWKILLNCGSLTGFYWYLWKFVLICGCLMENLRGKISLDDRGTYAYFVVSICFIMVSQSLCLHRQ